MVSIAVFRSIYYLVCFYITSFQEIACSARTIWPKIRRKIRRLLFGISLVYVVYNVSKCFASKMGKNTSVCVTETSKTNNTTFSNEQRSFLTTNGRVAK